MWKLCRINRINRSGLVFFRLCTMERQQDASSCCIILYYLLDNGMQMVWENRVFRPMFRFISTWTRMRVPVGVPYYNGAFYNDLEWPVTSHAITWRWISQTRLKIRP